jgi:hypothetical protein
MLAYLSTVNYYKTVETTVRDVRRLFALHLANHTQVTSSSAVSAVRVVDYTWLSYIRGQLLCDFRHPEI